MDEVLLNAMRGPPLSELNLATLRPGQTAVVMVDDEQIEDRTLEITVTITTFTRRATEPIFKGVDVGDISFIRYAHVSIATIYADGQEDHGNVANDEFGALMPASWVVVGHSWLMNIGDHSIANYHVRSITLFR